MASQGTLTLSQGIACGTLRADGMFGGVLAACGMEIGDLITYEGRAYVLRGLEPMSVPDRRAELEDPETGEQVSVPFTEVSERSDG